MCCHKNCNNIKHKIMIQNQNQNAIKCSTHCALCCFSLTCFDSDSEPRFQRFAKCGNLYSLLWVVVIHLHSHLNLTSVSCNAHWCTNLSAISLLIGTCTDVHWRKTRQKAKDLLLVKSWKVLKSNKKEWKVLKSPSIMKRRDMQRCMKYVWAHFVGCNNISKSVENIPRVCGH